MSWNGLRFIASARSRTMIGGLSAINGPSAGAVYFGLRGPPPTVVGSGAEPLFSGFFSCLSFPCPFFLRSRTAGNRHVAQFDNQLLSEIAVLLLFLSGSAGLPGLPPLGRCFGSASSVASSSVAGSVSSVEVSSEESSAALASCDATDRCGDDYRLGRGLWFLGRRFELGFAGDLFLKVLSGDFVGVTTFVGDPQFLGFRQDFLLGIPTWQSRKCERG